MLILAMQWVIKSKFLKPMMVWLTKDLLLGIMTGYRQPLRAQAMFKHWKIRGNRTARELSNVAETIRDRIHNAILVAND